MKQRLSSLNVLKARTLSCATRWILFLTGLRNLLDSIQIARANPYTTTAVLADIEHHIQAIMTGFVEYSTNPQADTAAYISEEIKAIDQAIATLPSDQSLPSDVNRNLIIATNHTQTILRQKPTVDKLLADIANINTTDIWINWQTLTIPFINLKSNKAINSVAGFTPFWHWLPSQQLISIYAIITKKKCACWPR